MYFPLLPGTSVSPSQGRQAGQGTDPEGDTMSRVMWEEEDDCVTLLVKYSRSDECLLERSVEEEEEEELCVSKSLEAVHDRSEDLAFEEDLEALASGIVDNVIVNLSHENRGETEIHSGYVDSPLKEEDVQEMIEKSGKGSVVEVDVLVCEFVTSVIHKAWQEHIEETRDISTCQTAYTLVPELNSEETARSSEKFNQGIQDFITSVISTACQELEEEEKFFEDDYQFNCGDDLDGFVEYIISIALEEDGDSQSFELEAVEEETNQVKHAGSDEVNRTTSKLWSETGKISEGLYEDSDLEDDELVADQERKKVNTFLVTADVHPVPNHLRDEDAVDDDDSSSSELSPSNSNPCISPVKARVQTISTSAPEVSIISHDLSKAAHLRGVKRGVTTGDLPGNEHLSVPVPRRRTVGDRARALFRRISRPFRRRQRKGKSDRNRQAEGEHAASSLRMSGGGQRAEVSSTDPGGRSGSKFGNEIDKASNTTKMVFPRGPSVALLDEDEITIDVTYKPAEPSRADRILRAISRPFTVCVSSS